MNKANLFVWKNIQVKKRTREISKVFHSYHPYDHKVGTAFRLFLCFLLFVCLFVLFPPSSFPFILISRVSLSPPRPQEAGREGPWERGCPPFLPRFRFFPACGLLTNLCVILFPFHILKVGERQTVLITEDAKDQAHFVGHNKFYDQVGHDRCMSCLFVCLSFSSLLSQAVDVNFSSCGTFCKKTGATCTVTRLLITSQTKQ